MPAISAERSSQLDRLPPADVLRTVLATGEKYKRYEDIRVGDIDTEGAIFDEEHARELGRVLTEDEFGITQDASVRARFADESHTVLVYDWIDGLHRIKGLEFEHPLKRNAHMRCAVLYNCTDEDLYRRRIMAANNVGSIRFARICVFNNHAWQLTPWHDKISVTQAYSMTASDSSGDYKIKNRHDVEKIKQWVHTSARAWNLDVSTIHNYLRTYDVADPDLVLRVRSGGTFQKGEIALLPAQLQLIAEAFHHDEYPGIQQIIANYVSGGVIAKYLSLVLTELKTLDRVNKTSVMNVIKNGRWKVAAAAEDALKKKKKRKKGGKEEVSQETVLASITFAKQGTIFLYGDGDPTARQIAANLDRAAIQLQTHPPKAAQAKTQTGRQTGEPTAEKVTQVVTKPDMSPIRKWMDTKNIASLFDNQTILEEFSADLMSQSEYTKLIMAKLFIVRLLSGDPKNRKIAQNAFSVFPFEAFDPVNLSDFIEDLAEHLVKEISPKLYHQDQIRDILRDVTQLLMNKFIAFDIRLKPASAEKLFNALQTVAGTLEKTEERMKIYSWVQERQESLVETSIKRKPHLHRT